MTGIPVLHSALILGVVGLFFGFVIALVNKRFRVWEDPRILGVEEMLPNTNCGACSQPGCRAFAEAVVGGNQQPSDCTVMGAEDIEDVDLVIVAQLTDDNIAEQLAALARALRPRLLPASLRRDPRRQGARVDRRRRQP